MRLKFWLLAVFTALTIGFVPSVSAQIPFIDLPLSSSKLSNSISEEIVTACIRLDGRCLFRIAAPEPELGDRVREIQSSLNKVSRQYLRSNSSKLDIKVNKENNLPVIDINGERLLTITDLDAKIQGADLNTQATTIEENLQEGFLQAKQERQPKSLAKNAGIASGTAVSMLFISWGMSQRQRRNINQKQHLKTSDRTSEPIATQLSHKQQWNFEEAQHRFFQLLQALAIGGGTLFILGLFPYTRILQIWILNGLQIPLKLVTVGLATYVITRFSYSLIDRFTSALASSYLVTPEADRRLQLRVSTISGVTKSIVTISLIGVGALVALISLGVNIAPLLAGAGLVGVAVSLASQNLIKDAINGFLIILEDQYAIGDVIDVGTIGGLVENMNLRITQLRDAEGRLITIPNSEIKIVANRSSNWSRADLNIPVAYQTDVNQALELIDQVGREMSHDLIWREQILETPLVLGVENFGDRGIIIRVWIKTQPLKQWDVAREYRRRMKVAMDEAHILIPLPQQEVWFNHSLPNNFPQNGSLVSKQ